MAIGCALQGSFGMGLALFAVPLLALIDARLVPGPMLAAGTLTAFASAYRERDALEPAGIGVSLLGLAIGTVLGAFALGTIGTGYLSPIFASGVLVAIALSVARFRIHPTRWALLTGGGLAGLMGTMVGIHGPPIALVFQHAHPKQTRAMLGAFFFVAFIGSVAALGLVGLFGILQLELAASLLPGVWIGVLMAPLLSKFVSAARLRVAILSISASSAILLFWR